MGVLSTKIRLGTSADHEVALSIQETQAEVISWTEKALEKIHDMRDDYREHLEL